ncbi:hypothetical protein B0H14DRAFT_2565549 [Mycena olivaceomarginata]|nr:hypothetical protein B0H14DRAFT_2565549 [Mycena olivaceomarginata]
MSLRRYLSSLLPLPPTTTERRRSAVHGNARRACDGSWGGLCKLVRGGKHCRSPGSASWMLEIASAFERKESCGAWMLQQQRSTQLLMRTGITRRVFPEIPAVERSADSADVWHTALSAADGRWALWSWQGTLGVGVDDAAAHLASACLIAEENTNTVPEVLASDALRCALQATASTRYRFPRSAEMYQLTTDSIVFLKAIWKKGLLPRLDSKGLQSTWRGRLEPSQVKSQVDSIRLAKSTQVNLKSLK